MYMFGFPSNSEDEEVPLPPTLLDEPSALMDAVQGIPDMDRLEKQESNPQMGPELENVITSPLGPDHREEMPELIAEGEAICAHDLRNQSPDWGDASSESHFDPGQTEFSHAEVSETDADLDPPQQAPEEVFRECNYESLARLKCGHMM
jgi:hypothetical protein